MKKLYLHMMIAAVLVGLLTGCNSPKSAEPASAPGTSTALTVEEYAVVERKVDQPTHFEYNERISKDAKEKRLQWRQMPSATRVNNLEGANAALAPFGYRLAKGADERFTLFKGNQPLQDQIIDFSAAFLSANFKDFALVVSVPGKGELLVRPAGIQPWDMGAHMYQPPVFVGSDLFEVTALGAKHEQFQILKNGKEVYRGNLPPAAVDLPLKMFAAWNDTWVLELKGDVLVGGKSIANEKGYDEVFGWWLIRGKPFYFYRDNGKVGLSYDGQALGNRYDEVIHYACCEPAIFNPAGNESMIWFHARRGEMWHYVEAGVYE